MRLGQSFAELVHLGDQQGRRAGDVDGHAARVVCFEGGDFHEVVVDEGSLHADALSRCGVAVITGEASASAAGLRCDVRRHDEVDGDGDVAREAGRGMRRFQMPGSPLYSKPASSMASASSGSVASRLGSSARSASVVKGSYPRQAACGAHVEACAPMSTKASTCGCSAVSASSRARRASTYWMAGWSGLTAHIRPNPVMQSMTICATDTHTMLSSFHVRSNTMRS